MRKYIILIITILIFSLLVSCKKKENIEDDIPKVIDTEAPYIMVQGSYYSINLRMSEIDSCDFKEGLIVFDNVDEDLFDKIEIDFSEVDFTVEGTYYVYFTVKDTAGNISPRASKRLYLKDDLPYLRPELYTETIDGEITYFTDNYKCFPGDWSYTAASSTDEWFGLDVVVTLPKVEINRYDSGSYDLVFGADKDKRNLDNPSLYFGGRAYYNGYPYESDVGLSYSTALINETSTIGSIRYKPFWRYETNDLTINGSSYAENNYEWGSSVLSTYGNKKNIWADAGGYNSESYYLPGDKLRIVVVSPRANFLRMYIEVLEVSKDPDSIRMREEYNWSEPKNYVSPVFSAPGHGKKAIALFKRVNAIDQVANEGNPSIPTSTMVSNAIFHEVLLYRMIDGEQRSVYMNEKRSYTYGCPTITGFNVSSIDEFGGQIVTIDPKNSDYILS